MQASKLEFKDGMLVASGSTGIDANKDGQNSVEVSAEVKINAAEALEEITKKDMGWLVAVLNKLGVKL